MVLVLHHTTSNLLSQARADALCVAFLVMPVLM